MKNDNATVLPISDKSHTDTLARFKRGEDGLVEGVVYKYLPNARIDWKAMINPVHIVFNRAKEAEIMKAYGAAPDLLNYAEYVKTKPVDEKHILILLQGFIELADLRGYYECRSDVVHAEIGRGVVSTCHISWISNCEDELGKTSSGVADATDGNTSGFGYLSAMADNRAFVRAVRRGLGISIMSFDELDAKGTSVTESNVTATASSPFSPQGMLKSVADAAGFVFMQVKAGASSKYKAKIEGKPEEWTGYESISGTDCMTLISILKETKPDTAK